MTGKQLKFKQIELFIIASLWVIVFVSPVIIFKEFNYIQWNRVFDAWLRFIPFLVIFLINHFFLVPYLLLKKKKVLYFASAVLMVGLLATSSFLKQRNRQIPPIERNVMPPPQSQFNRPPAKRPFNNPVPPIRKEVILPLLNVILMGFLVLGFDTGLKMFVQWSWLDRERISLEKENMKNQLAFLRNQVSPHFFMNTLNNIHALVDINTEEAKDSIIKLSKLMRYLLYESDTGLVPIAKEIEFIQSFVSLMELRFSNKVNIQLDLPQNLPNKDIPPMLFISLIENAFKHGISYKEDSFVFIKIQHTHASLLFEIKNSIHKINIEDEASGIGIENTRKRLDLLFGEKYHLNIFDENNEFIVNLTLPI